MGALLLQRYSPFKTNCMKKATFTFPDNDLLWQFKERAKGINIRIQPSKNTIIGLFHPSEIDIAVKQFRAVFDNANSEGKILPPANDQYRKTITSSKFDFRKMVVNLWSSILP